MDEVLERIAQVWVEVRAARITVKKKGRLLPHHVQELRKIVEEANIRLSTAFWTTRDGCIHFRPNFPHEPRAAIRAIVSR
jgi:hypothetical protein